MKERKIVPAFNDKDWFRFCSHIKWPDDDRIETDCWIFDVEDCEHGYPRIGFYKHKKKSTYYAMRVMCAWMFGDQPDKTAGHKPHDICGSRRCVSPYHLEWQTMKEQSQRQQEDGTLFKIPAKKGSEHPGSRLSENQVINIRKEYAEGKITQLELGKKYGVARSTICGYIRRSSYNHI